MKYTVKLIVTIVALLSVGAPHTYAQKKVKPLAQAITGAMPSRVRFAKTAFQIEPMILRAQVQQFVTQQGRWPRADQAPEEEMLLAKQANRFIWKHENTAQAAELALALKQLRQSIQQTERENEVFLQLLTFINEHESWPRSNIRAVTGALNKVDDMSAEQIAEFKLARQIEYLLAKDPASHQAQQIEALKKKWNK